jgi:hypothetical protein
VKTLANGKDRAEIVRRLGAIGPASERRWGKMTAREMICHLSDAFRVSMGEKEAKPVGKWFSRYGFKWLALWFPASWPHGVQTVPECEAKFGGTPPGEMERDRSELLELLDRFTGQPRGFALQAHPILGQMTEKEWMRWGYLHTDHHLRQFGG